MQEEKNNSAVAAAPVENLEGLFLGSQETYQEAHVLHSLKKQTHVFVLHPNI